MGSEALKVRAAKVRCKSRDTEHRNTEPRKYLGVVALDNVRSAGHTRGLQKSRGRREEEENKRTEKRRGGRENRSEAK